MEWRIADQVFTFSTDKSRLNVKSIHAFLTNVYWAKGRSIETVQSCIENSICFGVYRGPEQVAFARVVSDGAIFAYLMDVFVVPAYRGKGISKKLMEAILADPFLGNVKKWLLATDDAHRLYARFGFAPLPNPHLMMGFENMDHPENKANNNEPIAD